MKTLLLWLAFISLVAGHWWLMPKTELTVGERVRLTVPTVDFPEYNDNFTVLRRGKWEARIKDFVEWTPGEVVVIEGEWDGKRIISDTVSQCHECGIPSWSEKTLIGVSYVRRWAVSRLEKSLPEPMASLAVGILLGVRRRMPGEFYQSLIKTGTVHIVAASGFNVMMVAGGLMAVAIRLVGRAGGIGMGVGGIWLYVMLAGASASVMRAGVMGSLTLIAYYWGRVAEAKRLLGIAAGVMLLFNPLYLVDVGFQLSVVATAGLLYVEPWIHKAWKNKLLADYLYPTLASTIVTLPIILWHFGRVSWVSPLVNVLILPVIPLIMGLSAGAIFGGWVVAWLVYVPLAWVVAMIEWWG